MLRIGTRVISVESHYHSSHSECYIGYLMNGALNIVKVSHRNFKKFSHRTGRFDPSPELIKPNDRALKRGYPCYSSYRHRNPGGKYKMKINTTKL